MFKKIIKNLTEALEILSVKTFECVNLPSLPIRTQYQHPMSLSRLAEIENMHLNDLENVWVFFF